MSKITGISKVTRKLDRLVPDIKKNFAKELKRSIVDILIEKITSGISPVKGFNRYKKYSEGYAKKKGREQPVDLTVTGKMLGSMKARETSDGNLVIEITDKKAQYHDSKSRARVYRPMLPKRNQTFKRDIMNKIIRILRKAVKKST